MKKVAIIIGLMSCVWLQAVETETEIGTEIEIQLANDQKVTITEKEGQSLTAISKTLADLFEDFRAEAESAFKPQEKKGSLQLALVNVNVDSFMFIKKNLEQLNQMNEENKKELSKDLEQQSVEQLHALIVSANYLDMPALLKLSVDEFAKRTFSKKYIDQFNSAESFAEHKNNPVFKFSRDIENQIVQRIKDTREWKKLQGMAIAMAIGMGRFLELKGHIYVVNSVTFNQDGTQLATGSYDDTARIWDTKTGQMIGQPLKGHIYGVSSVAFSPDGTQLATGSWDKTAIIWDAKTGQMIGQPLRGHTGSVNSVAFNQDGTQLATGSSDYAAIIWDAKTGQMRGQPLRGHTNLVSSVAFSKDGTQLATGSWDKTARIWDAKTGQMIGQPLKGNRDGVSSVAFNQDGTQLATGLDDGTAIIWDVKTGQMIGQPLKGHTDFVSSVAFSPDGTQLATGSWDKTAIIWDTKTGQMIGQPLKGHTSDVNSVAWSPYGTLLATGSDDNTARIWNIPNFQSSLNKMSIVQARLLVYLIGYEKLNFLEVPDYLDRLFDSLPGDIKDVFTPVKEIQEKLESPEGSSYIEELVPRIRRKVEERRALEKRVREQGERKENLNRND